MSDSGQNKRMISELSLLASPVTGRAKNKDGSRITAAIRPVRLKYFFFIKYRLSIGKSVGNMLWLIFISNRN